MRGILVTNVGKTRCAAGINCVGKLPEELNGMNISKPMIVSDHNIAKLDKFKKTVEQLKLSGISPVVFDQVTPNPKDYEVMMAAELYKKQGCDAVIGIGGGSSMDCAKGVAVMVRHEGDIMDYGRSTPNRRFFSNGRETLFCIPTTTGTGSELSPHAVITNTTKNNRKSDVQDRLFYCDMFFLDPEFACTQPMETMRDTGVDALSHMIDSYTNKDMLGIRSPLHEAIGLECCRLISENLRKVIATGGADLEAVQGMQWGAAFGGAMLDLNAAAIHGLSGALQKYRHEMTHGVSCGVIMPACMEYNLQTAPEKFAKIADALGVDTGEMTMREAAAASVKAVEELLSDIRFPKFSDFNFSEQEVHEMAEISAGNSMLPLNPRPITNAEDVRGIYLSAEKEIR
ncbi:MAG: iron-containing alcohol dehydrogenase [Lachnospiraceae bacterium]|nr:iron-containing alcohol dehydrogenase [Lachnospiraceae bacterium]